MVETGKIEKELRKVMKAEKEANEELKNAWFWQQGAIQSKLDGIYTKRRMLKEKYGIKTVESDGISFTLHDGTRHKAGQKKKTKAQKKKDKQIVDAWNRLQKSSRPDTESLATGVLRPSESMGKILKEEAQSLMIYFCKSCSYTFKMVSMRGSVEDKQSCMKCGSYDLESEPIALETDDDYRKALYASGAVSSSEYGNEYKPALGETVKVCLGTMDNDLNMIECGRMRAENDWSPCPCGGNSFQRRTYEG